MKRMLICMFALIASLLPVTEAFAGDSCEQLNAPVLADDLLTVTMKSINVVEKTGSFQLTITYQQTNKTPDKKVSEGSFKLFFTDGTSTPQYGFFGSFFPGDSQERSHTWEYLKAQVPMVISYNAGFFAAEPSSSKLNWAPPGQACNLVSPVVKAKQEAEAKAAAELKAKQEAEAKAAAELKAKQEAEAKAAAELKAKQEAEAKAAAELKAKQEAEAKAAAEKAAAELKAKQEAEAKAAAEKAAAELKAKQEAEAKAAVERVVCDANRVQLLSVQNSLLTAIKSYPKSASTLNDTSSRLQAALTSICIADVTLNDFRGEVLSVIAQAKTSASTKKITITCVKGKIVKKVTAVNPKCPSGYKKK
jgi:chemotaxis protein histidine kinase CheA